LLLIFDGALLVVGGLLLTLAKHHPIVRLN
jgi:hypothetical protein